jgi:hypothetical protein
MKTEQEIEKQKQYIEKVKEINQGKNLKYYILTMGCQLNENDSEKLCGMVEEMGYKPTDDYKEADYSKGCWVTSYCGIGFNSKGYYACAVAAGIDRLTKKNMEIKKLKNLNNKALENQLDEFCRFCGNFKAYQSNHGDFIPRVEKEPFKNIVTVSWKSIYKQNSKKK